MSKKAFIITGPSSSGNHLMTELLVNSGCIGTVSSEQTFEEDFKAGKDLLVWRGSMPKGGMGLWDIRSYIKRLQEKNYFVKVIVMTRDMYACASSMVYKYDFNDVAHAMEDIIEAYKHIFSNLERFNDIIIVSYESLVFQKESTINWLSRCINITLKTDVCIRNENKKWVE